MHGEGIWGWKRKLVRRWGLSLLPAGVGLLALDCGGDALNAPITASLEVTAATGGPEPDPDGYTVAVDGGPEAALAVNATLRRDDLNPGDHTVQLGGMAGNCTVAGENPRTVNIPAGETATVAFSVTCSATTGSLQVTSSTSGPSPDADGYAISLDGIDRGTLAGTGSATLEGIAPGEHLIGLNGVAGNCQVQGDNPRSVTVIPGAAVAAGFVVTCTAAPTSAGALRITITTTGPDPDPDGYAFAVDGGTSQPIGVDASLTVASVAAGAHRVRLSGVAANCRIGGSNPRSVTVTAGATMAVNFAVTCSATTGTVRVSVTSSGSPPDPDGYTISLDGGAAVPIERDGAHEFDRIPAGTHRIELAGLSPNCRPEGENPRNVTVTVAATATVAFAVICSSTGVTHWSRIPLPGPFYALDLWGSSATDLFVAGHGGSSDMGAIWHYDGRNWSEQLRRPGVILGIWGSSPSDVFAVAASTSQSEAGAILHYDGAQWVEIPGPTLTEAGGFGAIWGTSGRDVFAGGNQFITRPFRVLLAHYDGTSWSEMPTDAGGDLASINGISGSSPIDVYAIGDNRICDQCSRPRNFVLHYDGTGWTESFAAAENGFRGLWVGASDDVWVVGEGFDGEGYILHYDGRVWTETLRRTPEGNVEPPLSDVWGSSGSDIYAVGEGGILHYDGTSWTTIQSAPGSRVWGTSTGDVFVLGKTGPSAPDVVLHGTP